MSIYAKSFTWVGNAVDGRTIQQVTGEAKFTPKIVICKGEENLQATIYINSMPVDNTKRVADSIIADIIQSVILGGFTVGGIANASGITYHAIMIGGSDDFIMTGSYVGDGSDNRDVFVAGAFRPDVVLVFSGVAQLNVRTTGMTGDMTSEQNNNTLTDRIQAINGNGFQVGVTLNGIGTTYYYAIFRADANTLKSILLAGTGGDNVNYDGLGVITPEFAWLKADNGFGAHLRFKYNSGDSSFQYATSALTNRIQDFRPDGVQLGTDAAVNAAATNTYGFLIREALPIPGMIVGSSTSFVGEHLVGTPEVALPSSMSAAQMVATAVLLAARPNTSLTGALMTANAIELGVIGAFNGAGALATASAIELATIGKLNAALALLTANAIKLPITAKLNGSGALATASAIELPVLGFINATLGFMTANAIELPVQPNSSITCALMTASAIHLALLGKFNAVLGLATANSILLPSTAAFIGLAGLMTANAIKLQILASFNGLAGLMLANAIHLPAGYTLGAGGAVENMALLSASALHLAALGKLNGVGALLSASALHLSALGSLNSIGALLTASAIELSVFGANNAGLQVAIASALHLPANGKLVAATPLMLANAISLVASGIANTSGALSIMTANAQMLVMVGSIIAAMGKSTANAILLQAYIAGIISIADLYLLASELNRIGLEASNELMISSLAQSQSIMSYKAETLTSVKLEARQEVIV